MVNQQFHKISVYLKVYQVFWSSHTHTADDLRQVVEVLYSASRPDSDPVDLVVQAVQEETQELLSILLATRHRNSRSELEISADYSLLYSDVFLISTVMSVSDRKDVRQRVKVRV